MIPGHGRSPQQADCSISACEIHREGASPTDAEDEGPFASELSRMADILKVMTA
jgi:hypothetical protein